ncbi:hypothetical protein ACFVUW_28805 [Streptomyces xiamenensis]|uniref:hypothetical protein n=1 Tax=Streptomyces xiamenensis TaxID=408015 RepID=UPI0036E8B93C
MPSTADKRAAQIHDRLSGRAQRAVEDQKKKLAEHWGRFQGMDPAVINASAVFKGLELRQRLIEMWSSVVGQCALRNAGLVFQDAIAQAEATIDIGVTAGMGTQVSNARQEMYVEACQHFREEAESIYKALS